MGSKPTIRTIGIIMNLIWKCKDCNLVFKSKRLLYIHRHESHNIKSRDRTSICKYCGIKYDGKKREHEKICEMKPHGPHKWTDAEKLIISEKRKMYLKTHPDEHPWKRNSKFKSEPCEHLKTFLKTKYVFEEEYTDERWNKNYSLDIAFLNKKLAIEVNGNQHYNSNGDLTNYFQKRHNFLINNDWTVLEVHYSWCYKEDKLYEIINAIDTCSTISTEDHKELFSNKKKSLEERRKEKLENTFQKEKEKLDLLVTQKEQILNSGIDLTKFGWVEKVSKITGLTRRQIYRIVNKTDLINLVFRR